MTGQDVGNIFVGWITFGVVAVFVLAFLEDGCCPDKLQEKPRWLLSFCICVWPIGLLYYSYLYLCLDSRMCRREWRLYEEEEEVDAFLLREGIDLTTLEWPLCPEPVLLCSEYIETSVCQETFLS
jgi:hypothetical protein